MERKRIEENLWPLAIPLDNHTTTLWLYIYLNFKCGKTADYFTGAQQQSVNHSTLHGMAVIACINILSGRHVKKVGFYITLSTQQVNLETSLVHDRVHH